MVLGNGAKGRKPEYEKRGGLEILDLKENTDCSGFQKENKRRETAASS